MWMNLGEKINLCIKTLDISQEELANLCGWEGQGRISHYIYNRREPNLKDIRLIATALKTTPEWLAFDSGEAPDYLPKSSRSFPKGRIPIVAWRQIPGILKELDNLINSVRQFLNISFLQDQYIHNKHIYSTEIPDSLINPIGYSFFRPKDKIIILPTEKTMHGQLIIVSNGLEPEIVEYGEKNKDKYYRYPGQYKFEKFTEDMIICGIVIARVNIFID